VSRERLETVNFPEYLPNQRWFTGESRDINLTGIVDWSALSTSYSALVLVEVRFNGGLLGVYPMPLAMTFGDAAEEFDEQRLTILASIVSEKTSGLLYDGVFDDKTCLELLSVIENGASYMRAAGGFETNVARHLKAS
jgi:hypothetical protein